MIVERGNAALGVRVEVEFINPILLANVTPIGNPFEAYTCATCGTLVVDTNRHTDFHYAIAARIGDGPPPGFRPV